MSHKQALHSLDQVQMEAIIPWSELTPQKRSLVDAQVGLWHSKNDVRMCLTYQCELMVTQKQWAQ
jgi:hypothetical protein